mmetsp:Transcript_46983/g.102254  ORF Transcript_46983/g.102254 Transcript_46983/m.102254 type:complete len:106 (-) Transcript_46983:463-780(-)
MSVETLPMDSLSIQRGQDQEVLHRHGNLKPKEVILAKLHKGHKWFDSGEYFLSKEGKVPSDLIPGGTPADALPPKLSPDSKYTRSLPVVHEPMCETVGGPSVSDY